MNKNTYLLCRQFQKEGAYKTSSALSLSMLHLFMRKLMTTALIGNFCCATVARKNKGSLETPLD